MPESPSAGRPGRRAASALTVLGVGLLGAVAWRRTLVLADAALEVTGVVKDVVERVTPDPAPAAERLGL